MTQKFLFDFLEADRRRSEAMARLRARVGPGADEPAPLAVNPYVGCQWGCAYCFARGSPASEAGVFKEAVAAKEGVTELRRAIAAATREGRSIALGTLTDPYQPLESEARLTRRWLEELSVQSGLTISLATKSRLVLRDIDMLRAVSLRNRLRIEISLMSLDDEVLRLFEPKAESSGARLEVLRRLSAAGLPAGIVMAPVIPGLTDSLASLESVVRAARLWRADFVDWAPLSLPARSRDGFLERVEALSKPIAQRLARLYAESDQAPVSSKRLIATRVRALKLKYDFTDAVSDPLVASSPKVMPGGRPGAVSTLRSRAV